MTAQRNPVAIMAKHLESGKQYSGHNWYRFFDLWLEAILLSLKPCTVEEWKDFLCKNHLEQSEEAMTAACRVLVTQAQQENRDYLGPLYEVLAVNDTHNFGQFFTPWDVAKLMVHLNRGDLPEPDLYRAEPYTICDPCVGSGTLLLAWVELVQNHDPIGFSMGHYQFYGQDKDSTCVNMAEINLLIRNLNRPFVNFQALDDFQQLAPLILWSGYNRTGRNKTPPAA